MKTDNIVLVKSIALEIIDDDGRLNWILKIDKAEQNSAVILCFSRNESDSLESRIRPEYVSYFSLRRSKGDTFHIDWISGMLWNVKNVIKLVELLIKLVKKVTALMLEWLLLTKRAE